MSDTPIPPTDPAPVPSSVGLRALANAQAELAAGVHADPPDFHHGAHIALYFSFCVRNGKLLGLTSGNWCAAFASFCIWTGATSAFTWPDSYDAVALEKAVLAWAPGLDAHGVPVGYRAAVSEFCADAEVTGTWHDTRELGLRGIYPQPGDLLIFGRDGADPRAGGAGHVVLVEAVGALDKTGDVAHGCDAGESWVVISGNGPGGKVTRETRTARDSSEPMVGWISLS